MGYTCTNHDGTPAVLLVTNLTDGDTVALCAEDIHPWAAAIAAATDPEAIQEAKATAEGDDQPAYVDDDPGDVTPGTGAPDTNDPDHSTPAQTPDPDPASTPDTPVVYPDVTQAPDRPGIDPDYPAPSDPAKVAPRDDPAPAEGDDQAAEDDEPGFSQSTVARALAG